MLQLPNACKCSTPSVFPKNWNKAGATAKLDWRIQYYFYDPAGKRSLRVLKGGINTFKTVAERRVAVKDLMDELLHVLQVEGYNPITGESNAEINSPDISPDTHFIAALNYSKDKLSVNDTTKKDLRSVIKYCEIAAKSVRLSFMPVGQIRRKHIKQLFEQLGKDKDVWTANTFNFYRAHLMMLFSELLEYDAVDTNPLSGIKKQKYVQEFREVLTGEQRNLIDTFLKANNYIFWRLVQIFFHSGARETELLSIQGKHVDLARQRFKVLIKKGKAARWEERTIKDVALPLWAEALEKCGKEDYVFSKGLLPGASKIRPEQITRRWRRWVKVKLGISADFYSMKHSNLDETAALLDVAAAAKMAGHTTPVITLKHYAHGEADRQHDRLKGVNNPFAG